MTEEQERITSLRALAHPARLRMLSLLTGAELSAAEVARELDLTHANASYHLRVLLEAGEIVEAGEERIRGGVAKRYRHPWRAEDRPQTPPTETVEDRDASVRAMADELVRRAASRRPGTPALLTDAELWVAPETWAEVRDLLHRASALVHDAAQPPRSEGTVPVALTVAAFERTGS